MRGLRDEGRPPGRPLTSRSATAALSVAALVFSGGLAELACRVWLDPPGLYRLPSEVPGMTAPHPTRGWGYTPNFSGRHVTEDYATEIRTNALGFRDRPMDLNDLPARPVLAVGDSFTSGLGVERHQTWVAELERIINASAGGRASSIRVVNAGINAYSLAQMRRTAEELLPLLRPRLLVAGVYVGGYDRFENPFVFLGGTTVRSDVVPQLLPVDGGLLFSPFFRPWAIQADFWLDRHFHFGAHLVKSAHAVRQHVERMTSPRVARGQSPLQADVKPARLLQELDSLAAVMRAARTPLVVLLINRQQPDGSFGDDALNATIIAHCLKNQVPVVDPLPVLKAQAAGRPMFRFPHDAHWTAPAHALAAGTLADVLINDRLLWAGMRAGDHGRTAPGLSAGQGRRSG